MKINNNYCIIIIITENRNINDTFFFSDMSYRSKRFPRLIRSFGILPHRSKIEKKKRKKEIRKPRAFKQWDARQLHIHETWPRAWKKFEPTRSNDSKIR